VLKAGISADTQSDFGAGVGVGYSFVSRKRRISG
ncbi:hypothetical protein O5853_30710, partial [Escherichia coli]|nr:hypothetical protein [Escherichia coli]